MTLGLSFFLCERGKFIILAIYLSSPVLRDTFIRRTAKDNGPEMERVASRRVASSGRGFRAEVLASLTNAFYVFSRDYFARSATPAASGRACKRHCDKWRPKADGVRLRRDPRGNPVEGSIPEFLLENVARSGPGSDVLSTVVTLVSFSLT